MAKSGLGRNRPFAPTAGFSTCYSGLNGRIRPKQDYRAIKRVSRPILNFESFHAAGAVLAGIELVRMILKGQVAIDGADPMSFVDQLLPWQKWSVQFEPVSTLTVKFCRLINNATAHSNAHQGHLANGLFFRDFDLTAPAAR